MSPRKIWPIIERIEFADAVIQSARSMERGAGTASPSANPVSSRTGASARAEASASSAYAWLRVYWVIAGPLRASRRPMPAATSQSVYSQWVSSVGNKAREVNVNRDAQESLVEQATAAQKSAAGVNLDEEAANLIRYQQAYQAAGKVMSIASKLFDQVLSLGA